MSVRSPKRPHRLRLRNGLRSRPNFPNFPWPRPLTVLLKNGTYKEVFWNLRRYKRWETARNNWKARRGEPPMDRLTYKIV